MSFTENLKRVKTRVQKKGKQWGRDVSGIQIIAVSKKQPLEKIEEALVSGQRIFGENRVQDAMSIWGGDKGFKARYDGIELHLIGALQTNKVQDAVSLFDSIHTLDRPKLADALKGEMERQGKGMKIFIQVNTGGETQKSGVTPEELEELCSYCRQINLKISGLMCLPPVGQPAGLHFAFLKTLAKRHNFSEVSMGMSGDFEKAVPFVPSYIRVGSILFGERG